MSLKNVLIVVEDIEKSKRFYHDLFGLTVVRDFGENVILTEGLVLQERNNWERLIKEQTAAGNASELFFEENEFDVFLRRAKEYQAVIVAGPAQNAWGRRSIRIRDLDGHLIEVAER